MSKLLEKKAELVSGKWDAIVIGSGIGGMTTAAALAKYGWKVAILEQHYVAGGCTHMFSRKGYSWDVGVHCVGEMTKKDLPGKIVAWLSNDKIEMNPLGDVYDQILLPDGFNFVLPDTVEKFKKMLNTLFPDEGKAIDRYLKLITVGANSAKFYFVTRLLPAWLISFANRIFKFFGSDWWMKTTDEVLRSITPNEKLRAVFAAQWGYYGATPKESSFCVHALTIRHFWNGGFYPVGGAKTFADHFLTTVEGAGGSIFLRTSVKEVIIENGKAIGVKLDSGESIYSPRIISAAGAKATVDKLLPSLEQKTPWVEKIKSLGQSRAYVTLYLGFEGDILSAGATKANQWHYETWDMEKSEWDVNDPQSIAPFLFISFPSLKDPHHLSGEKQANTGEIVTFVPWEAFEKWKHTRRGNREADYSLFKKDLEQRLFNQAKKHLPKLMEKVRFMELSTPLSTEFFIRAPHGAIYGLNPVPKRFDCDSLRTRTPIKHFYLSGCDVATLGVAGALTGGLLTAATLEPKVLTRFL